MTGMFFTRCAAKDYLICWDIMGYTFASFMNDEGEVGDTRPCSILPLLELVLRLARMVKKAQKEG